MMTSRLSAWFVISLAALCRCIASPDMFTALTDMQRALNDEQSAAILLRHYVQQERQRLDSLERLANEWESHSQSSLSEIERHVFHPVNYFLMTKRFTVDWQRTITDNFLAATTTTIPDLLSKLANSTTNYPSADNFMMSASALLRLQDTYNLQTTSLSTGQIGSNVAISPLMSADDCFQLGKVAYNNDDFYHSVLWFTEALRIHEREVNKSVSHALVLDYFSFATFKQGNLRHAYNLTVQWLAIEPDHSRAQNNLHHFQQQILAEEQEMRVKRQVVIPNNSVKNERVLDEFRSSSDFDAYERLCRGEYKQRKIDNETKGELVCRYRRHVPMFYIRPLKEELINVNPRIVVYHDIITDTEINKIKQLATPKLHRSGVFTLKDAVDPSESYTSYRTSKSAWIKDLEDPIIARVSQKASALSNLTLETAEEFQVLNYGIGGHYEPHYDFNRANEESTFSDWQGNRIATVVFYLNDVDAGGFTVFNLLGISQPTSKGSCLLWYNLLTTGEGDYRTRHAGCPVLVGTKWVANKWFHYGGQLFSRPCYINSTN